MPLPRQNAHGNKTVAVSISNNPLAAGKGHGRTFSAYECDRRRSPERGGSGSRAPCPGDASDATRRAIEDGRALGSFLTAGREAGFFGSTGCEGMTRRLLGGWGGVTGAAGDSSGEDGDTNRSTRTTAAATATPTATGSMKSGIGRKRRPTLRCGG